MRALDERSSRDSLDEDLKHMPGLREQTQAYLVEEHFVVFACNWRALEVFLNCAPQWRHTPDGQIVGLDYPTVHAVMSMMGIKRKHQNDTFQRLRHIEVGLMGAIREMRDRN